MNEAKVHVSVEQRIIIKFLTKEGCKLSEICSRLKRQYGEKTLSNVSVYKWSIAYQKGSETENEPHEHRPRTSITGVNSDCVNALIRENRQITVRELPGILNISEGSVKTIIKQHFQYSKVCARWIPRLLTDEHKSTRLQVAQSLLSWYEQEEDFFFGFYHDKGRDVGALLHAQEQTFFNAVASRRVFETQKRENHVLCWEGYGHHLLGL